MPQVKKYLLNGENQKSVTNFLESNKQSYEKNDILLKTFDVREAPLKEFLSALKASHPVALQRDYDLVNVAKSEEERQKIKSIAEELLEKDAGLNDIRRMLSASADERRVLLYKQESYEQRLVLKYLMMTFLILEVQENENDVESNAKNYQNIVESNNLEPLICNYLNASKNSDALEVENCLSSIKEFLSTSLQEVISCLRKSFSTADRLAAHAQASASEFLLFVISALQSVTGLFKSYEVIRPFLITDDIEASLEQILVRDDKLEDIKRANAEVLLIDVNHISFDDRKISCPFTFKTVLKMDENVYHLVSVIVHDGNMRGGHYYSYAKTTNSIKPWILFNDESVDQVIEQKLFKEGPRAHLFLFVRQDTVESFLAVPHWTSIVTDGEYLYEAMGKIDAEELIDIAQEQLLIDNRLDMLQSSQNEIKRLQQSFERPVFSSFYQPSFQSSSASYQKNSNYGSLVEKLSKFPHGTPNPSQNSNVKPTFNDASMDFSNLFASNFSPIQPQNAYTSSTLNFRVPSQPQNAAFCGQEMFPVFDSSVCVDGTTFDDVPVVIGEELNFNDGHEIPGSFGNVSAGNFDSRNFSDSYSGQNFYDCFSDQNVSKDYEDDEDDEFSSWHFQ